jgi:hypothetical protein
MVTSPNLTLTLQHVPVSMAGAAGGALQTVQRIGSAIGTALLATVLTHALASTGSDYAVATFEALLCATALMLLALLVAIADLIRHRVPSGQPSDGAAVNEPLHPDTADGSTAGAHLPPPLDSPPRIP